MNILSNIGGSVGAAIGGDFGIVVILLVIVVTIIILTAAPQHKPKQPMKEQLRTFGPSVLAICVLMGALGALLVWRGPPMVSSDQYREC
jgi:hypothetical protein